MSGLAKAALAVAALLVLGVAGWIVVADGNAQRISRFAGDKLDQLHRQLMRLAARRHTSPANDTHAGARSSPAPAKPETQQGAAERRAAEAEAARKEAAWKVYFHPSPGCGTQGSNDMVECGNEYVRARRTFEDAWAAGRLGNSQPSARR